MLYQKSFLVAACGKIFQKELFENIQFPSGILFEDSAIMYKVFDRAERVAYGNAQLYAYRHREGSITTKKFSKRDCDILLICTQLIEYFAERDESLRKAAASYCTVGALRVYMNAPRGREFDKEIRKCRQMIKRYGPGVLFDSCVRKKTRIGILMFFVARPLMPVVYRKINRWK